MRQIFLLLILLFCFCFVLFENNTGKTMCRSYASLSAGVPVLFLFVCLLVGWFLFCFVVVFLFVFFIFFFFGGGGGGGGGGVCCEPG